MAAFQPIARRFIFASKQTEWQKYSAQYKTVQDWEWEEKVQTFKHITAEEQDCRNKDEIYR